MYELRAVFGRLGCPIRDLTVTSGVALVKVDRTPGGEWFRLLGGAVKAGRVEADALPDRDSVGDALAALVNHPLVGISSTAQGIAATPLAAGLKSAQGAVKRYVVPTDGPFLSAAQSKGIRDADGSEWLVLGAPGAYSLVRITDVQDIDEYTRRDRDLPVIDMKRGILPTKLARMMANIALGEQPAADAAVLLDPFCGTGRILLEGMLLGSQVLGADIDPAAIEATRRNLAWAAATYRIGSYDADHILTSPIEKVADLLSPHSIAAIATEPFLGPPATRALTAPEQEQLFARLTPQYEALLRAGRQLLVPGGTLVAVFPLVRDQSLLQRLVDRLPRFGYHLLDSIPVTRSDQWIARDIALLCTE